MSTLVSIVTSRTIISKTLLRCISAKLYHLRLLLVGPHFSAPSLAPNRQVDREEGKVLCLSLVVVDVIHSTIQVSTGMGVVVLQVEETLFHHNLTSR